MTSPATGAMRPRFDLTDALAGTGAPLLFGVRLWVSVCLALFVAFWLQLDNPSLAGATAAIMSQPQLGASLRKGWFRVIGTVIGAVMIVVLTAFFPQDRIAFLDDGCRRNSPRLQQSRRTIHCGIRFSTHFRLNLPCGFRRLQCIDIFELR